MFEGIVVNILIEIRDLLKELVVHLKATRAG